MGKVGLFLHDDRIMSFAYDGLVIIHKRERHDMHIKRIVMPHHRIDGGACKAYMDPYGKHIVTLGRDGNLVCTILTDVDVDHEKEKELIEWENSERFTAMFSRPTLGFTLRGNFACLLRVFGIDTKLL